MTTAARCFGSPRCWGVLVSLLTLVAGALSAALAPVPEASPRRWLLDVNFGPLRVMSVQTDKGARAFYYLTYTATNRSGKDQSFAPTFDLVDGDMMVTRAGANVPDEALRAAKARIADALVEDPIAVIGTIGQGAENAKSGFVVFSCEDLTPGRITVYAAGFSGETAVIRTPDTAAGPGGLVTLRRTMALQYNDPGDLANRRDVPLDLIEAGWVMR